MKTWAKMVIRGCPREKDDQEQHENQKGGNGAEGQPEVRVVQVAPNANVEGRLGRIGWVDVAGAGMPRSK